MNSFMPMVSLYPLMGQPRLLIFYGIFVIKSLLLEDMPALFGKPIQCYLKVFSLRAVIVTVPMDTTMNAFMFFKSPN